MKEANVKVEARHIEVGDWIAHNIQGVYRMGKVLQRSHRTNFWQTFHIRTEAGDKFELKTSSSELVWLMCFAVDVEEQSDRDLDIMITRMGRAYCVKYCTIDLDVIGGCPDYKFRSRDGRYFFKDGSFIRVNDDGTRTLIDGKGKECEWPVNRRKRT
jgi:hypothetical protein